MHKFTIFTIIFSVVVVLIVADLVVNDYWGDDFADQEQLMEEEAAVVTVDAMDETAMEEDTTLTEETEEVMPEDDMIDEDTSPVPEGRINDEFITALGLTEPVLETTYYDGLIYGFWDTSTEFENLTVLKHKIFDGATYVGTIYEIQTTTEIETFDAYEALRDIAINSDAGEINENNAAGDASFYFNHSSKTGTIFLTLQKNSYVYAFEYLPSYHSKMKPLIDML